MKLGAHYIAAAYQRNMVSANVRPAIGKATNIETQMALRPPLVGDGIAAARLLLQFPSAQRYLKYREPFSVPGIAYASKLHRHTFLTIKYITIRKSEKE